ncbi:MAG: hypothetical protein RIS47_2149 [Bacteroidota bacterium]|jgi:hypothetical protein
MLIVNKKMKIKIKIRGCYSPIFVRATAPYLFFLLYGFDFV